MKKMFKMFLALIFIMIFAKFNLLSGDISLVYPMDNQVICNDGNKIRVEWKYSGTDDFYIRIVFRHIPPYYSLAAADSIPVRQGYAILGQASYFIDYHPFDLFIRDIKTGKNLDSSMRVTVYNRPAIHEQSSVSQVCKGHPLKLFVIADGDFQSISWFKDGKLLPDRTDQTLWLINPDERDNGTYKCVLNSDTPCGSVESKDMRVVVGNGPDVMEQPVDIPFVKGRDARFRARFHLSGEDSKHVKLQWWRDSIFQYIKYINGNEVSRLDTVIVPIYDGVIYSGAQSDYLSVKMNNVWSKLNYYCQASTGWGCTFTQPVRVMDWFDVISLKNSFYGCAGQDVEFEIMTEGITPDKVTYQWYTNSWEPLPEGDKFEGTKTRNLKIKNIKVSDNGAFYCRVTDPKTGYYANSPECFLYTISPPEIKATSGDYVIKDHNNQKYGTLDLWIRLANDFFIDRCYFGWYQNGNLVYVSDPMHESHYLPYEPRTKEIRPALKSDTGSYVCRIWNQCGEIWSDTMRVTWGFDDVSLCEGEDAILKIDKYLSSDDYDYKWFKNGKLLSDSVKITGSTTNELKIFKCDSSDNGEYFITAVNKYNGSEHKMGKIFLNVNWAPKIFRAPDDTVNSLHDFYSHDQFWIYYKSGLSYRLYNENGPVGIQADLNAAGDYTHIFELTLRLYSIYLTPAERDTLPEGLYRLKAWNNCGVSWSKAFYYKKDKNSINTGSDEGGIVGLDNKNDDNIEEGNLSGVFIQKSIKSSLRVYPNPAANGTKIEWIGFNEGDDPLVEIYNSFGSKVKELSVTGLKGAGTAEFYWDGLDMDGNLVSQGLYFAKITSGGFTNTVSIMIRR